ncbi:MAG: HAD family hydrolase [Acidobacteria bacterium]|nr:HAD family hydrolase [Acidobacteriota bacterium]
MPNAAIVFDLDGTLIDSRRDVLAAFHHAFEALGEPAPEDDLLVATIGHHLRDCFRAFLKDSSRCDEAARQFRQWYDGHYLDATFPFPGIDGALQYLSSLAPLAVVTMKKGYYSRKIVTAFGWDKEISFVVGAEEGLPAKPDPAMLLFALEKLGASPEASFYVGDTDVDAATAEAARVPFLFAAWGYGKLAPGQKAQAVLQSPDDLAMALLSNPETGR